MIAKPAQIEPHLDEIFDLLHLLYEDLKLKKLLYHTEGVKLRKLLFCWLLMENKPSRTAYMTYYMTQAE